MFRATLMNGLWLVWGAQVLVRRAEHLAGYRVDGELNGLVQFCNLIFQSTILNFNLSFCLTHLKKLLRRSQQRMTSV